MIGVYKRGRTFISCDNGKTWSEVTPNPTVRTATGKVWGQRTADGRFALLYNPTPDGWQAVCSLRRPYRATHRIQDRRSV